MDEEQYLQKSPNSTSNSTKLSLNLGRVINTLLTIRPRKIQDAISRLNSTSHTNPNPGSLEESLCFLRDYVSDAVEKGESLDQILVPMIENSLKSKDSRHCNQVLILLNWLFKDDLTFHALAVNLVNIILRKDDRYIVLGWCTLICGLVDYRTTMISYSNTGIHEKHTQLLQILFPSISHLSSVLCTGSTVQEGFELPTRLAIAAADCILVLTKASTEKAISEVPSIHTKSPEQDMEKRLVTTPSTASVEKKVISASRSQQGSETMEVVLWNHMDKLIILVQKLLAWSRKSRPLHAKGVEHVQKWLLEMKGRWESVSVKAGDNILKTGISLLSSCWKHYGTLLRLEDRRFSDHYLETLNQYVSGIQLQCADEDVIELTVSILRATIFKTNTSFIDKSLIDTQELEIVFPSLLSLLDERDTTSRAVVMLTAEYCSLNIDGQCLQDVFRRLSTQNIRQRTNALDILSEIMQISSASRNFVSQSMRQDIAQNLLARLADDESVIRVQASKLLASFGSKFDSDQLLKLIPQWTKSVQDWNIFIEPLLNKMFTEPSNAVVIRFMSYISDNLAEAHNLVLHRVLVYMQGQKEIDEKLLFSGPNCELNNHLFDRLCPLLLIKMTPLRIFDDLNSTHLYGQLLKHCDLHGEPLTNRNSNNNVSSCIASILITRALHKFEFEDVRKLAAELCGRIHPQILFPIIQSELELASYSQDILKIKSCLFAICTSLVLRGIDSAHHRCMLKIRSILETILLWPPMDSDQVSKAQHGCIDCLALMICAELQNPESKNSVVNYVIENLTRGESKGEALFPISYCLCMANVLISACQKISSPGKPPLAKIILPALVQSVERITDGEIRAAIIQVLFSAVYHLKSTILPYSCDLLKLSIKSLNNGSHKEKMASVKLMASLMASEDVVIASISGGLLEARAVVSNVYLKDPSMELREVCKKLLECITLPSNR
ncbi:hypothetical protein ACHQM5_002313 [Ranunculus cassubicifolius]